MSEVDAVKQQSRAAWEEKNSDDVDNLAAGAQQQETVQDAEAYAEQFSEWIKRDLETNKDQLSDFSWMLRGKQATVTGVRMQTVQYVKRGFVERVKLRRKFSTTVRTAFLKTLGNETALLRKTGFSEGEIMKIQDGEVPSGWQVHHKLPLDDSGTNSFLNLVLIKNEPYHKIITNYQNSISRKMKAGEVAEIEWPIPVGATYPLRH